MLMRMFWWVIGVFFNFIFWVEFCELFLLCGLVWLVVCVLWWVSGVRLFEYIVICYIIVCGWNFEFGWVVVNFYILFYFILLLFLVFWFLRDVISLFFFFVLIWLLMFGSC